MPLVPSYVQKCVSMCRGTLLGAALISSFWHVLDDDHAYWFVTSLWMLARQNKLPDARVVYCSATGASEPRNMGYMTRLGLWGAGTDFPHFSSFLGVSQNLDFFSSQQSWFFGNGDTMSNSHLICFLTFWILCPLLQPKSCIGKTWSWSSWTCCHGHESQVENQFPYPQMSWQEC